MTDNVITFPGADTYESDEPHEPLTVRVALLPPPQPASAPLWVGLVWMVICGAVSFAVVTALLA